ncbi:MAG: DUF3858 domain-containing protein [Cyclobacteriaceae bacterium]
MKKILFIAILTAIQLGSAKAQKTKFKYGKISTQELKMEECAFYPDADAMILGRTGRLSFHYNNDKGWQYNLQVIERKKILKQTGKDEANVKISVYSPKNGANREDVGNIKGTTYNLVNGKVKKTKLTNSEEYETRINDYRVEVTFAMPDVKQGSVIEYKYNIKSDYISNLSTWHFQSDLPTAYSEFAYTIPEYFFYQKSQVGNLIILDVTTEPISEQFTYRWESTGTGGNIQKGTGTLNSNSERTTMIGTNILPLEEEPFMNNKPNLPSRVEFQLASIDMPNSPVQNIASDYQKFNKRIMDWTTFGKALDKGGFAKDFIETLAGKDPKQKAIDIYRWISENVVWNDYYSMTSDEAGRQTFKNGTGNVGDINLTLAAALIEAGIKSDPVILSTRGHGIPHPVYPDTQDFNYVVVAVTLEDGVYLLDATARLPFGYLPKRCLNGQGWFASNSGGHWIDLKNGQHTISINNTITFSEESIFSSYEVNHIGYAAIGTYSTVTKNGIETLSQNIAESFTEGSLENFDYPNTNNPLNVEMKFDLVEDFYGEDIIYLNPTGGYGAHTENPFKRDERFSPVDFPYATSVQLLIQIEVPDGYKAELPESTVVRMPNNAGSFVFSTSQVGNRISIVSKTKINKLDFFPDEYSILKQFYQLVTEKNKESVVLKRI